jgi:hypothetical protein
VLVNEVVLFFQISALQIILINNSISRISFEFEFEKFMNFINFKILILQVLDHAMSRIQSNFPKNIKGFLGFYFKTFKISVKIWFKHTPISIKNQNFNSNCCFEIKNLSKLDIKAV